MKKFFLSCLTGLLCAAWGQAQITGGDFDNGYRAVYLSSTPPQVTETEGLILPEVSNADQLTRLVEVTPGSNTYSGYCNSADIQEYYIYTKLAEDGTFAGENCVGLAAEKTFTYDDKDVIMQKATLKEGPQCHPLRFQENHINSYRMLVDLNEMAIYVEANFYLYIQVKGHEDETSYKNFENVSKIGYDSNSMRAHLTADQEFRVINSLIPYSSYFSYGEIGNIRCAPRTNQTVQLNDNGIAFLTESYEMESASTYGWWKITKTGDYLMNQTFDVQESEVFAVMKFMEVGSVKELYISENGNTDMTDPDNIFNWLSYQVPSADRQASWEVKLLPVEGQPGVFAGNVNFAYHPDWKMLGVSCFDTFRTDENARYVKMMSVYAAELKDTNDLCAEFWHPNNGSGAARIGVYYPGITERVTSRLIVDINKGTAEVEIEPENYEAIVPLNSPNVLYLVGMPSGWTVKNVPEEWQLGHDENGVFVRTFYINAGEFMLRFYTSLGNWDFGSIGCQYDDFLVDCEFSADGVYSGSCCEGKGSWYFPDWPGGYVTMEVNIAARQVKFTKADAIPDGEPIPETEVTLVDLYENVTLMGDFGNFALTNAPTAQYNYTAVIDIPAGKHTFGIDADGIDIGAWKDGRLVPIEKNADFFQRYYLDNTNLWATPDDWEGGKVVVDMNLLTHNISFQVPQPDPPSSLPETLELIGEFNNWNPVEAMPLPHLGNGIYEATFSLKAGLGEFVFRTLNSWDQVIVALYTHYCTFFTEGTPSTLQAASSGYNFKLSDKFLGGDVKFHIDLNDMTVTASSSAVSGIPVLAADTAAIRAAEGKIVVTGMAGTEIRVYDLSGHLVLDVTPTTDSATYTLAPGFYIAAGHKLIVK